MRAAVGRAVAFAPAFLRGEVGADRMAHTMIDAARDCAQQEDAAGAGGAVMGAEARPLQEALRELMACGSGYLAGRCDAACVARTMTFMVNEFGP